MSTEVAVFWKTQHDDRGPEQTEAHAQEAGDGAGAVGHLEGRGHLALTGGGRGADVPRTAMLIPMKPVRPEHRAPARKQITR